MQRMGHHLSFRHVYAYHPPRSAVSRPTFEYGGRHILQISPWSLVHTQTSNKLHHWRIPERPLSITTREYDRHLSSLGRTFTIGLHQRSCCSFQNVTAMTMSRPSLLAAAFNHANNLRISPVFRRVERSFGCSKCG